MSNLESGEALWLDPERKKETLDEFFEKQLSAFQRSAIRAARVDMWEPFRQSIEQWAKNCRIVYDKFHIMQDAASAVDEVRRAEFFRKGGAAREIVKVEMLPVAVALGAFEQGQETATQSTVRAEPRSREGLFC